MSKYKEVTRCTGCKCIVTGVGFHLRAGCTECGYEGFITWWTSSMEKIDPDEPCITFYDVPYTPSLWDRFTNWMLS